MTGWPNDRDELLAWLAAYLNRPAERIAATRTWQQFADSFDSLALAELIMELEEELLDTDEP